MKPGEIYLARFPFGDVPGMKLRLVLLLKGPVGAIPEILVAYISSVTPPQLLPSDLIIDPMAEEFESTHLKVVSTLRLHKRALSTLLVLYAFWAGPNEYAIVAQKVKSLLAA